jgi:hypothetical protein
MGTKRDGVAALRQESADGPWEMEAINGRATELDELVGRAGLSAPWGAEIGCIQLIDGRTPEQGKGKIEIVFQELDGASHARLSGSGKP